MRWANGFIAVDWGTTNRRAYLIGRNRAAQAEMEDDRGAVRIPAGSFPEAVSEIRDRLGNHPMLLAGMAGSTRGWISAPYLPAPLGLAELVEGLVWAEPDRAAIIPGVSYADAVRADIMRGEEVQILGAVAAGLVPQDCTVCHPGTHAKWVRVEQGRISAFRTIMTGEMFNLLRTHSILSEHLEAEASEGQSFQDGVRAGLTSAGPISDIFSIRAQVLLGRMPNADAPSFLSGFLVGADVRTGIAETGSRTLHVMGSPQLTALYAAALREAGRDTVEIDGEEAFIAGAVRIAESMT
jgi:2-dehydro-3-deoxygalactonokinase